MSLSSLLMVRVFFWSLGKAVIQLLLLLHISSAEMLSWKSVLSYLSMLVLVLDI